MRELSTVDEIHRRAAGHPVARASVSAATVGGYATDEALLWLTDRPGGRSAVAHGTPAAAAALTLRLWDEGRLAGTTWLSVPRGALPSLAPLPLDRPDEWDLRWTRAVPPPAPGAPEPVALGAAHAPDINRVLDAALPKSSSRPGDPAVVGWYGIEVGRRLVACAADISRATIGLIAAVAVHPEARGRGLGAALTGALTARLLTRYDVVGLGVMADNVGAARLYHRLGYTDVDHRASAALRLSPAGDRRDAGG